MATLQVRMTRALRDAVRAHAHRHGRTISDVLVGAACRAFTASAVPRAKPRDSKLNACVDPDLLLALEEYARCHRVRVSDVIISMLMDELRRDLSDCDLRDLADPIEWIEKK